VATDSVVIIGPNLILAGFNVRRFFSEGFIPSATDTSKYDQTPVALCVRH
jgi:hypothetical protein